MLLLIGPPAVRAGLCEATPASGGFQRGLANAVKNQRARSLDCSWSGRSFPDVRQRQAAARAAGAPGCDLAEVSAPVSQKYPTRFVSYAEVRANPKLHIIAGKPPAERDLNVLIGANVEAGRIMAGVTFSTPGNWTSWPPHEHARMLEEAYLFVDMPAPAFGVQFVYTDPAQPELVQVVREGDCVLMPQGYHPNVAAPGTQINFLWMMAAIREGEDRLYGVVNVQPEFAAGGSGLEAAAGK